MEFSSEDRWRGLRNIRCARTWDKISHAAWACADPGLQYDTTINEWHTCPEGGRIARLTPVPSICSWMIRPAIWLL